MRDPARIPVLCGRLRRAWERSPDLRLGQLLMNVLATRTPCPEVFYAEDSRTGQALLRWQAPPPPPLPATTAALVWSTVPAPEPSEVRLEGARTGTLTAGDLLAEVLEIRFGGAYRPGSQGRPDAEAMALHILTLLAQTRPDAVLLDLSALRYVWGDGMIHVLDTIGRFDPNDPLGVAVLGGAGSTDGLRSLGVEVHEVRADAQRAAEQAALRRALDIG